MEMRVICTSKNFYPRSPCGERRVPETLVPRQYQFLSTLSLRRATNLHPGYCAFIHYFYPRSPCGERRRKSSRRCVLSSISIHALLAESDLAGPSGPAFLYNFYPRSPCGERLNELLEQSSSYSISIHALLAESDRHYGLLWPSRLRFLSTLSLRRATWIDGLRA